jgi:hypothetical protein
VVGLIASDGCLSKDGRHIFFVSKDLEQIKNFLNALKISCTVGIVTSGHNRNKAYRIQLGDVNFYNFLLSIGLMPAKSKIIGKLNIPDEYFFDFLRGSLDGDGCTYSYWDPRWRSSFMFYTQFCCASLAHILWLQEEVYKRLDISGYITQSKVKVFYQLKYAKKDSIKLLKKIYYKNAHTYLSRKKLKINKALHIMGEQV